MALSVRILVTIGLAAIGGVASARDYSGHRVIDTATLDLMAGPVNTAVLLSPDGSRLLHIGSNICLLAPAEAGAWKKAGCIKNRPDYEAQCRQARRAALRQARQITSKAASSAGRLRRICGRRYRRQDPDLPNLRGER